MVTLNSEGGFQLSYPGGAESVRVMLGLVRAILWEDEDRQQAMVADVDPGARPLVLTLATALASSLVARVPDRDLDAPPFALTVEQRQHAEAVLVMAITRPDDDDPGPEGDW
jgi:hypothetical protein